VGVGGSSSRSTHTGDHHPAITGFAGDEPDKAVFYPEDDRFLIQRDLTVSHYVVIGE
jgi:hypothetical protein